MEVHLSESDRRWLHAALVLGTLVLGLILLGLVAEILVFFSDLLLVLLLAWLLAFMISPLVNLTLRAVPFAPRVLVVGGIYTVLFLGLSAITLVVAGSLAGSIGNFINELPNLQARLPELVAPIQSWLQSIGLGVDLVAAADEALRVLAGLGDDLVGPLTDLALASLGMLASLLIVVFLSLFIVLDKDRIIAYLNRLVPPRYSEEARLFETSVASSFGGFIRGQAIQGVIYAAVAIVAHLAFGLEFLPASAALAGVLQAIPFFGPFLSWAPPVVVALLTKPDMALPTFIVMAIGWFVVMNIVQPRVMASAVGINPVAVLVSVLVGLKIAGIAGAIFALPFTAVMAAFFHHFLDRSGSGPRDVASRAARRVGEREGRAVRVPTAPPVPAAPPGGSGGASGSGGTEAAPRPRRRRPGPEPAPGSAEPGA
ncbi:MAG TPA: AI-2E family transporter [Candidatus Limnocylindria bacterium]|nr:AI-2E family transporter [Candidatus Limnocylindria bacterium]